MKENIITTSNNLANNTTNINQTAELEIRSQLFENCNLIAPLGGCKVQDCLSCHNSDCKIVMSDGTILKDFTYNTNNVRAKDIERYTVEFFDNFDPRTDDIVTYLNSEGSNYKITRNHDNTVLRSTNNIANSKDNKPKTKLKAFLVGLKKIYS